MKIENMTIFYRKKTGQIKNIMSDAHDMSVFGDEQEDYEMIWDYIVVEVDEYLRNNISQFYVDVETKELVYIQPMILNKYKIK